MTLDVHDGECRRSPGEVSQMRFSTSRAGTIEYVNPATGELWDGQGSNPPPRRTRHVYFGLEVIQEYACGGENVFCEAERAMVREFLHGGRGDQVGASTGIFHAPSSDYGTHAQLRYPETVAMIRHNPDTQDQWTYHYLHDVLGSVIGVVDEDGDLVERFTLDAGERLCRSPRAGRTRSIRRRVKGTTYDPYGRPFIETWDATANEGSGAWVERASECGTGVPACGQMPYSPTGNPFLWTGHRYDAAVGLYHTLFRTYSPTLGRWLQRDPIEYDGGSINLYEYVLSSPVVLHDPYGLQRGRPAQPPRREVPPPHAPGSAPGASGPGAAAGRILELQDLYKFGKSRDEVWPDQVTWDTYRQGGYKFKPYKATHTTLVYNLENIYELWGAMRHLKNACNDGKGAKEACELLQRLRNQLKRRRLDNCIRLCVNDPDIIVVMCNKATTADNIARAKHDKCTKLCENSKGVNDKLPEEGGGDGCNYVPK